MNAYCTPTSTTSAVNCAQSTLNPKGLPTISPPEGYSANDGRACAGCVPGLSQPTTTLTALFPPPPPPPSPWWTYSARSPITSPAVSVEEFCEPTVTSGSDVGWIKFEEDANDVSMTSSSRIQSLRYRLVVCRGWGASFQQGGVLWCDGYVGEKRLLGQIGKMMGMACPSCFVSKREPACAMLLFMERGRLCERALNIPSD